MTRSGRRSTRCAPSIPTMVLLHGGTPTGAERIAVCWADSRKVAHIPFRPNWTRHAKAAPFKRNDDLLAAMPIGLVSFPGSASPATSATRPRSSASRCGASARVARKRHLFPTASSPWRRVGQHRRLGLHKRSGNCVRDGRTPAPKPGLAPAPGHARAPIAVSVFVHLASAMA